MNWCNLRTEVIRSPEYVGSEPIARATWLNVTVYCCEQENGGRIKGAKLWKCRQWQQTCGVTLEEINASTKLLTWVGEDLLVWNYPKKKESIVKKRREVGRLGGGVKSDKKRQAAMANGAQGGRPTEENNPSKNPSKPETVTQAKTQGNGMEEEGNGIGMEVHTGAEAAIASSPPSPPASGAEGSRVQGVSEAKPEPTPSKPKAKPKAERTLVEKAVPFAKWFRKLLPENARIQKCAEAAWARAYDEMVRIDRRPEPEIGEVCRWARQDPFWRDNFFSPAKLRERKKPGDPMLYDRFLAKMKSAANEPERKPDFTGDDW